MCYKFVKDNNYFEDIDVSYDVQEASDGEVYVTIYMR